MATEPAGAVATKATLAGLLIGAYGPLLGQYVLVLVGAFGGVILVLLDRPEPLPRAKALAVAARGIIAALLFASAASSILASFLPPAWQLTVDVLWLPVSAAVAMYWREAISNAVKAVSAWAARKPPE